MKLAPLVDAKKVLFPPLLIKLGFIKKFVRKMNPEGEMFKHIQELFPKLSEAKVRDGIFVGPHSLARNFFFSCFYLLSFLAWP